MLYTIGIPRALVNQVLGSGAPSLSRTLQTASSDSACQSSSPLATVKDDGGGLSSDREASQRTQPSPLSGSEATGSFRGAAAGTGDSMMSDAQSYTTGLRSDRQAQTEGNSRDATSSSIDDGGSGCRFRGHLVCHALHGSSAPAVPERLTQAVSSSTSAQNDLEVHFKMAMTPLDDQSAVRQIEGRLQLGEASRGTEAHSPSPSSSKAGTPITTSADSQITVKSPSSPTKAGIGRSSTAPIQWSASAGPPSTTSRRTLFPAKAQTQHCQQVGVQTSGSSLPAFSDPSSPKYAKEGGAARYFTRVVGGLPRAGSPRTIRVSRASLPSILSTNAITPRSNATLITSTPVPTYRSNYSTRYYTSPTPPPPPVRTTATSTTFQYTPLTTPHISPSKVSRVVINEPARAAGQVYHAAPPPPPYSPQLLWSAAGPGRSVYHQYPLNNNYCSTRQPPPAVPFTSPCPHYVHPPTFSPLSPSAMIQRHQGRGFSAPDPTRLYLRKGAAHATERVTSLPSIANIVHQGPPDGEARSRTENLELSDAAPAVAGGDLSEENKTATADDSLPGQAFERTATFGPIKTKANGLDSPRRPTEVSLLTVRDEVVSQQPTEVRGGREDKAVEVQVCCKHVTRHRPIMMELIAQGRKKLKAAGINPRKIPVTRLIDPCSSS